ncbi:MAG: ABC transporter permease [Chloroflexi bacterium]|nr:ABC transporter permease [Chloroflexota bacterium]MBA3852076.1 ABC transporter permease [Chloroflexota bacterium]
MTAIKILVTVLGEMRKELRQILRRPVSLFGLVAGPFLVMGLFGIGFIGSARPLDAILVISEGLPVPRDAVYYERLSGGGLRVLEVTSEREPALARLERGETDLVVVAPAEPRERFLDNERSVIQVWYRQVDPTLAAYAELAAARLADQVNREVLRRAIDEGYQYIIDTERGEIVRLSPEVVAQPVAVVTGNTAPTSPGVVRFFGPAVLALIVQHLALMLGALSLVGERRRGFMELLRVSPASILEFVMGKVLAFTLMTAAIGAVLTWLLVEIVGVPFLGDWPLYAAIMGALILASLASGLLIGSIADSDLQAVNIALLTLLLAVFFGGFVVPVHAFAPGVQLMAEVLPARNAALTLQEVMLYGETAQSWRLVTLAAVGIVFLLLTLIVLSRRQRASS